ncbi:MAG: hypothetical protein J2P13_12910 [Acidobacteria bacterium]|nr:hypothetical protein [Acidobacteriota bacterium]
MDSFDLGNPEYQAWERGNIRSRSRVIGLAADPLTGEPVEVYGFFEDEFAGTKLSLDDLKRGMP